jgi:hypothetical protein
MKRGATHASFSGIDIDQGKQDPADVINAILENPMDSRVKTELNCETGLLKVSRILQSSPSTVQRALVLSANRSLKNVSLVFTFWQSSPPPFGTFS